MVFPLRAIALALLSGLLAAAPALAVAGPSAIAQSPPAADPSCPKPALDRMGQHTVAPGETLASIAAAYNLLPETLMGFNPDTRQGAVRVGQVLDIPPYNGIVVAFSEPVVWRDVAAEYRLRPDLLYEVNGCVPLAIGEVFIPGQLWTPAGISPIAARPPTGDPGNLPGNDPRDPQPDNSDLIYYPLARASAPRNGPELRRDYGWQLEGEGGELRFNSGVVLVANPGQVVLAAGPGTVAFAGSQAGYGGNLVVVNHQGGRQTRYANLGSTAVRRGQQVAAGDPLGTVSATPGLGLVFELRYNTESGWVAQDPKPYLRSMR